MRTLRGCRMGATARGRWVIAQTVAVLALGAMMPPRAMGETTVRGTVQCYILITAPERANLFLRGDDTEATKRIEVTTHVFNNDSYDLTLSGFALQNEDDEAVPEFVWTYGGVAGSGPRVGWWDAKWRETSSRVLTLPGHGNMEHSVDIEVHMDSGGAPPGRYRGDLTITPALAH